MFKRSTDHKTTEDKIAKLYDRYSKLMRAEAYNILKDYALAEDAVHQSFIKIMSNMNKINHNNEAKIRNFLVIICRNTAIDIYKKRLYLNENSKSLDYETDDDDNIIDYREPSKILIDKENIEKLANYIDKLPQIYKDVLLLEKLHNNTKEEIAKLLGIKYETVRKRSLRARKMLIEALEKEEEINGKRFYK